MSDLLPCFRCGNKPWGCFGPATDGPIEGHCWIECHGDKDGDICGDWYYPGTREETEAAWNQRAQPAAGVQMTDEFISHVWSELPANGPSIDDVRAALEAALAQRKAE